MGAKDTSRIRNAFFCEGGREGALDYYAQVHKESRSCVAPFLRSRKGFLNPINTFVFVLSIKWLMPLACPLTRAVLIVALPCTARGYVGTSKINLAHKWGGTAFSLKCRQAGRCEGPLAIGRSEVQLRLFFVPVIFAGGCLHRAGARGEGCDMRNTCP
jgi:hypothetical protein